MSGHRVVRDVQPPRDLPGWKTVRFVLHKQSERLKPRGLGKCRKCFDGTVEFHMSGSIDTIYDSQATGLAPRGRVAWRCQADRSTRSLPLRPTVTRIPGPGTAYQRVERTHEACHEHRYW